MPIGGSRVAAPARWVDPTMQIPQSRSRVAGRRWQLPPVKRLPLCDSCAMSRPHKAESAKWSPRCEMARQPVEPKEGHIVLSVRNYQRSQQQREHESGKMVRRQARAARPPP